MEYMEAEYPYAVMPAMESASYLAVAAYDALGSTEVAEPIELPADEILRISARWALTTGDSVTGLELLTGSTDRRIFNAARDTLMTNGLRETGTRFMRVPRPEACPWCKMLGTRGAVYLSEETAGEHNHFHDECHCRIVIERKGGLPMENRTN